MIPSLDTIYSYFADSGDQQWDGDLQTSLALFLSKQKL